LGKLIPETAVNEYFDNILKTLEIMQLKSNEQE
jgi:hypothetical protein